MKKVKPQGLNHSGLGDRRPAVYCKITSFPLPHCCTILESISEGVFAVDPDKRITYLNPAAASITGFGAEEALGQKCFDIFRANLCETGCPLEETLATGTPCLNIRAHLISKSGQSKAISLSTSILKDEEGRIIGGVEIFQDLSEIESLKRQLSRSFTHEDIVGRHPRMREILAFLPDIAESETPVLIEGPTGSGKELIARAIHNLSLRKEGPFVTVNCAALPDTLLESELFGYVKGAFTGALRNKPGRFLLANKGTLFLDEISSTSPAFQADLLRVVEGGEFMPLGDTRMHKVDFRLITAANLDLKKMVQEGTFREDLYYRLAVVKISLPPLRERREDIPLLVEHFIHKFNLLKGRTVQGVCPEVLSFLMDYPFPGNIRELQNIIEYAFIACKGNIIRLEHLSADLLGETRNQTAPLSEHERQEAEKIRAVLKQYPRNRSLAARVLGVSRTTLWRRMKKYGLAGG